MHLHFDCFSGISGDMVLGALVDAGLSPTQLRKGLQALPIAGYRLHTKKVHRGPIMATKVDVKIQSSHDKPLSWPQIRRLIQRSTLPPWVKKHALAVFTHLAEAEGKVHGHKTANIHFHEVGVIDSLVDVVGGLLGCHLMKIQTFSATPVNVGSGTTNSAHGILPVPPPAVAELAKGIPIFSKGPEMELTTPTGMALLKTLTQNFQPLSSFHTHTIGYGAGSANPDGWINALRVLTSTSPPAENMECDQVIQLETNIDDLNPQIYEVVIDRLFEIGALDVTLTPVTMKRSRPGIVLSVLAKPEQVEIVTQTIFQETSTIGLRTQLIDRLTLPRHSTTIRLPQGKVRVKTVGSGKHTKRTPEFKDCQALAKKTGRPVREIIEEVIRKMPNS